MQVAAHACLIGDDGGVAGVGFAFAAVGAGCTVDHASGDVDQILTCVEEDLSGRVVAGRRAAKLFQPRAAVSSQPHPAPLGDRALRLARSTRRKT
jgi:hypothetical protein